MQVFNNDLSKIYVVKADSGSSPLRVSPGGRGGYGQAAPAGVMRGPGMAGGPGMGGPGMGGPAMGGMRGGMMRGGIGGMMPGGGGASMPGGYGGMNGYAKSMMDRRPRRNCPLKQYHSANQRVANG